MQGAKALATRARDGLFRTMGWDISLGWLRRGEIRRALMQAARARSLALMEQQVKPALESFSVGEGEGEGAGWQWVLVGVSRRASGPLDNTCCIAPGPPPPNGCCQTHGSFTPRSSSPNAATTPTTPRRHEDAGQLEVLGSSRMRRLPALFACSTPLRVAC
jgi:hypothetical protein